MHAYSNLNEHQINESRSDQDLRSIFNTCFANEFNTVLEGNASEPLYTPAISTHGVHTIFYRHDYFSSALHEIAHWCIAGKQRRQQIDYGYWYEPDTRTPDSQHLFVSVEAKPQALEWIFTKACRKKFVISLDNPDADLNEFAYFKGQVVAQAKAFQQQGLPKRAQRFYLALQKAFAGQMLSEMIFTEAAL